MILIPLLIERNLNISCKYVFMSKLFINRISLFFIQALVVTLFFGVAQAYNTSIHVPAVLGNTDTGVISVITLNVTPGNGTVKILGPEHVGQSTLSSAITGANYASNYLNINESKFNFTYFINDNLSNVTGPSGGLAFTLLAISGLSGKPIRQNFTLTGTISSNGVVGPIGGITDKVSSAKAYGLTYVLAPYVPEGSFEYTLYYISQQLNNIPIVEVSNVSQAIPYAFSGQLPKISPLTYTISSSNFSLASIPNAPFNCNCNESYFDNLVNYTLNMTSSEINNMPSNFSALKTQFYSELATYKEIASKGYEYTAADSAFIEYINAYIYANSDNYTLPKAYTLYNTVLNYCNSLTPPNMTPQNYQYIISGQARQSWAQQNLITANAELNSTQSTDNIIEAISTIGESAAWCDATNNLFSQASKINMLSNSTTPYTFSSNIEKLAHSDLIALAINNSQSMYYAAALNNYNQSQYGSALYTMYYLMAQTAPVNASKYNTTILISSFNNSLNGIWPVAYGNSAVFYAEQASLSNKSASSSYLFTSYQLSLIARGISNLNNILENNFTLSNTSISSITAINSTEENQLLGLIGKEANTINTLNQKVNNIETSIELIILMVVVLLIALLYSLAKEFSLRKALALEQNKNLMKNKKTTKKG